MKVIILSKSSYKEKDCIYSAISPEGYLSFMAKGAQDPKSKYVWLNNPLTVADVDFLADGRYKHKVINSAIMISSPMVNSGDFDYLVGINVLAELSMHILDDEEKHLMFSELEAALSALRSKKDLLLVILIYFAKLIKLSGTELEVNHCVFCGNTKDIVAFSFADGGFVCENCLRPDIAKDLSSNQMRLIHYIFKVKDYSLSKSEIYTEQDKKVILSKLKDFIDDFVGVKLHSLDVLIK